jgi:hypothetical protein
MICQKCKIQFDERDIDVSHDVPCYLFEGVNRQERKKQADKWGRHNICKKCHNIYENEVIAFAVKDLPEETKEYLRNKCKEFSKRWFYVIQS